MSKFKVGDKVRLVNCERVSIPDRYEGTTATVEAGDRVRCNFDNKCWYVENDNLEPVVVRTAFMPVHLPFPSEGVTVATLDKAGNLTIKVDQPSDAPKPIRSDLDAILRAIGTGRKIEAIKLYRSVFDVPLKDAKDAVELAMPIKPLREPPDMIADRILALLPFSAPVLGDAIADAICAERSGV